MGKALLGGGFHNGAATFGSGGTSNTNLFADGSGFTTESNAQFAIRAAGTLSDYGASFDNQSTGRSKAIRKNGANGNLALSFPDSTAAIVYDTTHSDSFSNGDLLNEQTFNAGQVLIYWTKAVWLSTSGHTVPYVTPLILPSSGITTGYAPIGGYTSFLGQTATEANAQSRIRAPGTAHHLQFRVVTARSSGTMTATLRKNGAAGNLTVTSPSATTGLFEDTTHTDTLADGDLVAIQFSNQNFLNSTIVWGSIHIDHSGSENEVCGGAADTAFSAVGTDRFMPLVGATAPVSSETPVKIKHHFACNTRNLRCHLHSNTLSTPMTLRLRKNGADGNQSVSMTNGVTGWFEDTTHTDSFGATDDANYKLSGGTSGSVIFDQIMLTEGLAGVALVATNLTVSSPVLGTPAYSKNGYDFIASFPPHNPEIGTPDLTQKHVLSAVGITVARPFIQIPGLTGFNAISLVVGSPEFGAPTLTHPWGFYTPIPTLSQQIQEAEDLLDRVLDRLLRTVPNRVGGGRPAWDFRRQVGDIRRDAQRLIVDGTLGAALAEVFGSATAAGATLENYEKLRREIVAETPKYVPAEATAHLATQATLAQMTAITVKTSFVSRDEALSALNRITTAFEPAEEDAADERDPAIYRALVAARAAAVRDLAERGRQLPRVIKYKFGGPMPALWIANRLYGDGSRADQLRDENKWIHPAFAPEDGVYLSR